MRHFRTPTVCASKYPSRAAKKYIGGTRAIAERTVFNGRKCSSAPRTMSAAIHRKAMNVQSRAVRRAGSDFIMNGESQREGYRKTANILRHTRGGVSPLEQARCRQLSLAEDFVDFTREREIAVADAVDVVGVQIDHDFVPHVEPLGMMVQGFGNQRDARHFAESRDKILARELAMQLAIHERPVGMTAQAMIHFRFRQFLRSRHMYLQNGLGFYLSFAQTKLAALFRSPVLSYFATLG